MVNEDLVDMVWKGQLSINECMDLLGKPRSNADDTDISSWFKVIATDDVKTFDVCEYPADVGD